MTDDLERRLREDSKAGVGAGSDWSAEECATYWSRQCSTARRNAAEAADELARLRAENEALREALGPFAEAAEDLDESTPDRCSMWEHHVSINVDAGDFRRAAAAIRTGEAEQ